MTRQEMKARNWDNLDILLITGDAYVDHPSFGIALLSRLLEHKGYKVGIIAQPKVNTRNLQFTKEETRKDFLKLGIPRLFIGITSGVLDSMLNNYTANKRIRTTDTYSVDGKGGKRPDYAAVLYGQIARKLFKNNIIIGGGLEFSLRRLAHYDYWKNNICPSILYDSKVDLLVHGMGENQILAIAENLKLHFNMLPENTKYVKNEAEVLNKLHNISGIGYLTSKDNLSLISDKLILPSFKETQKNRKCFLRYSRIVLQNTNPFSSKTLVQLYKNIAAIINPAAKPLASKDLDLLYSFPYTKKAHWIYKSETGNEKKVKIPALETVAFSITTNRGCFGGCTFCSITLHQGKIIQSRSINSIKQEIKSLTEQKDFKGYISDLGGPTANMYNLNCKKNNYANCERTSCLHPNICKNLITDHSTQIELLNQVSKMSKVKNVVISSGVRYDLAMRDMAYLKKLIQNHVGGHLKVAPEHMDKEVLNLMHKPPFEEFEKFRTLFDKFSAQAGKEQYIVPYFIASFPGSTLKMMNNIRLYLKKENWKLQQVQNYMPLPMTLASAYYWSELTLSYKPFFVAKSSKDREKQIQNLFK